ncbi:hypothetical protein [Allomuricauda sp. SCSIO 65647]|uniref:hypothetical protein n=1 Tax=Allomuricauda sp. SCSIO 65647 TaxID=2908843 RepID=UPI001F3A6C64|nr:hypothetical protein [Muricauda sp. SCSIO 65647]UJH67336.1 hypothetical protein L0P89_15475 [Muricauda sp. SCSIO 65647]
MKKSICSLTLFLFVCMMAHSQIDANSVMGIPSDDLANITAITNAQEGAIAYATDTGQIYVFSNSTWVSLEATSTLEDNGNGSYTYTDETGTETDIMTTISSTTIDVDQSFMAKASVSGDSNQPNTILTLTTLRTDTGWSINSNRATFNDTADYVEIDAMAYMDQPQSGTYARINPVLELLKNGTVVARSASGYQRHATSHRSSSNTISYIDHNPSSGDEYYLRAQQGSSQNDVLNIDLGHFDLIAVKKVTVLQSVTN